MLKWFKRLFFLFLFFGLVGIGCVVAMYYYVKPDLPDVETIKTVKLQTPMKVFSVDGELISQFGEKRRIPLTVEDFPPLLLNAFLATEDNRFYHHPGIDPIGIVRAAVVYFSTGHASQGASTITQQVARNFFLTREKTLIRKIKEIFIAIHIEQLLSKDEILELYLNKIPLGYRSYGVGAAAQVYYGKDVKELTLAQMAVIAGLPKAPSRLNPLHSPENAKARRAVVLGRMLTEKYITKEEFEEANNSPISAKYHGAEITLPAPFVAEMVRRELVKRYGEERSYSEGLTVITTISKKRQHAANQALVNNLLAYDLRHGFRGPVETLWKKNEASWSMQKIFDYLKKQPIYGPLKPAVVTSVKEQQAEVLIKGGEAALLEWDGLKWARRFVNDERQGPAPSKAADILSAGDMIWVRHGEDGKLSLSQFPNANAALVALDPKDGAIQALTGGFDYKHSKFNRATQAKRQAGSNIKPFLYSAALEKGFTLASMVNDAPINHWDARQGVAWRPKNSPPVYDGPTRVRVALGKSKNVVSVRLLRSVGIPGIVDQLTKFGFSEKDIPHNESLALGSASFTPMEVATAYSIIANGGYKVEPYIIERIEDAYGNVLYQSQPKIACAYCQKTLIASTEAMEAELVQDGSAWETCSISPIPESQWATQVISTENAFLMREALISAIWGGGSWAHKTGWNGTGWRAARVLKRHDIGGKTGTTNDAKDAWYTGFGPELVATSWVGFDNHSRELGKVSYNKNLGKNQITGSEFGGKTALPAWINFMQVALEGTPEKSKQVPDGIVMVRIDVETGKLSKVNNYTSRFEYFEKGTEPTSFAGSDNSSNLFEQSGGEIDEELF